MSTENEVRDLFNRIASDYDRLNDVLSLGLHRIWKQMTVKWVNPAPGAVCLDVCCGSGDLAQILARRVGRHGQVYGLDFSAMLLTIAQQRDVPSVHKAPIAWVEGDALALSFPANTFDGVTMGYGLRNVTDVGQSLAEILRVLKPGGRAAILDFCKAPDGCTQQFQQWYLHTLVVPIATQLGLKAEYTYIEASLARFLMGSEQVALAQSLGFGQAKYYAIAANTMGILVLQK
ncbi:bifunctional demethylmenaquinone methyltransferase/2-methoxy-6-polyprenyl-1,4-benzoquinol methylase UbiE [Synechococcales cyanobacterium C]|uniref:2-phytyl-1,4-naphtoquinone methyltransferase n=2 Tax=Petrachloros TaxID=2918834 RepID=A0A8K1ZW54_9CYAN|nr:bifunctional demethylmenaquinone methyltransferase/2-methoxy-6-polyprenyl-1,4-benzoquinol methylase UbiE [Petrachloros mirabilis]NCJ04958.1 bifunctional demethylmenaquinone methyltransferase/2-methoxy-6-polyprenyl-1,4-benzoquinol methylase UbiE [Petrachloros mirabilis ULC683]